MACCAFDQTVNEQFTREKANQELEHCRRKGVGPTTRRLIDGLARAGLMEGTLLDIGAGVGSLTFELLDRRYRHAKPAGRQQLADIALRVPASEKSRSDPQFWAECVVGAIVEND